MFILPPGHEKCQGLNTRGLSMYRNKNEHTPVDLSTVKSWTINHSMLMFCPFVHCHIAMQLLRGSIPSNYSNR